MVPNQGEKNGQIHYQTSNHGSGDAVYHHVPAVPACPHHAGKSVPVREDERRSDRQEAGGNVALGSDQAPGNNCHNIIHEMKNVCMFNKLKYQNPEIMPAWKALRMATIEGAKAVGVDDIVGSLEPGKQADFIAIDLNYPSMLPVYTYPMRNIVPNLVYSARGQEVALSVVNGRVIMKDQKILTIDENESLEKIKKYPAEIGKRAAKEFFEIHGTNAMFMEEDKL